MMEPITKITTTDLKPPVGAGYMLPEQATRFIDMTVDESVLLKMVRIHRTSRPQGEIDKLNLAEPVTEGAAEATDTGNLYPVNSITSKVEFTTKKVRSAFDLSKETLEDNIEGAGFRQTILQAFAKRIATDLEMLAIQGDKTKYAADTTALGRLLKVLDGWEVQTRSGVHLVDANGAIISKSLFSRALRAMPRKYLIAYNRLRWFASPSIYQDYVDQLTDRQTTLGDTALTQGNQEIRVFGIPLIRVPLIPENLGDTGNRTFVWLTFPENFIWVIQRAIEVNWFFNARKDSWENTTFTRIDALIENKDAVVRLDNLTLAAV